MSNILEPATAPPTPPPAAAPVPSAPPSREALERRKLEIQADENFLDQTRDPLKHELLVDEWRSVFTKLDAMESEPPAPEAAPSLPFAVPDLPGGASWGNLEPLAEATRSLNVPDAEVTRWMARALEYANPGFEPPDPDDVLRDLKAEWGADFDRNLTAARLATRRLPADVQNTLTATGLGDDPALIRRMAKIGEPLLAVVDRKAAIEADPNFLNKYANPEKHEALRREWNDIFRKLHGT